MVQNYRQKFDVRSYTIRRGLGAIGLLLFAICASYFTQPEFDITQVDAWRWFALMLFGFTVSAGLDRIMPYIDRLREQHARMQATSMSAPDAIVILSGAELRYEFANEAACRLIEHISGVKTPVGMKFRDVHSDAKASGTESLLMGLFKSGERYSRSDVHLKAHNNTNAELVCDMRVVPMRDQYGQIAGLVIYYVDQTERIRLQRAAEISNLEKTTFITRAGIEMQQSLSHAREMIGFLKNGHVAISDRPALFDSVLARVDELRTMGLEMTELGQIHSHDFVMDERWYELAPILNPLLEEMRVLSANKGIRFIFPESFEQVPSLLGDPNRIAEILSRLFSHALKLTQKGRIEFRMKVDIDPSGAAAVECQVIYTGLAQDAVALTHAKQVAKLMGGDVRLEQNSSGAGFVFVFTFQGGLREASRVLKFGAEAELKASDEEISRTGLQTQFPVKKTGS